MAFKSRNTLNLEKTERFKLYKSGKLWLVTGLSFFSILGGTLVTNSAVHADTIATTTSSTSSSESSSSSVNTYISDASNVKSTDVSDTDSTQATSTSNASSSSASEASSSTSATSASDTSSSASSSDASSTVAATSTSATSSASDATSSSSSSFSSSATSSASSETASSASSETAASTTSSSSSASTTTAVTKQAAVAAVAESTTVADTWTIGDTTRPRVDVVDVSSYQSGMTQADYNTLKSLGVKTVIVKATEGTTYTNPYAVSEAQMANQAGLNVDFYHYATFSTTAEATAEAANLVSFLTTNSVSKNVLIFADMEDSQTYSVNAEANLNAFWSTLSAAGYTNHGVYASKYYAYITAVTNTVGSSRVWMAQYPYTPSSSNLLNTTSGAWQFASTAKLPSGASYTGDLDVSIDYTGLTEDSAGTATFVSSSTSTGSTSTGSTSTGSTSTGSTSTGSTSTSTTNSSSTTVTSGTYTFTGTTAIKSAASDSSTTVGTYYKGSTVNYNAKITINGETWLRYLAVSGAQRYVKIGSSSSSSSTTSSSSETIKSETGSYTFSGTTAIKSSASDSASTVGTYYKGNTVYYNAKITVNGQTWLRYLSTSGAQHYVKISGGTTSSSSSSSSSSTSSASATTTATSGTYTFTGTTAIKSAASDAASTVGTYYKGSTVNYNAKITVNGETWLRYLAASGAQRYVKISGTTTSSTSTANTSSTSASTGTYTFKTTTNIRTGASLSASIVGEYYAGETVRYIGIVSANGYQWLKYIAASGAYHYAAIIN